MTPVLSLCKPDCGSSLVWCRCSVCELASLQSTLGDVEQKLVPASTLNPPGADTEWSSSPLMESNLRTWPELKSPVSCLPYLGVDVGPGLPRVAFEEDVLCPEGLGCIGRGWSRRRTNDS